MLHPGLYEQVINTKLRSELAEIPQARKETAPIDRAEASRVLSQYLADIVQKGLDNVLDNGGDIAAQVALTNQIVTLIQTSTQEADFAALSVAEQAEQLLALLREADPRLAAGKTAADLTRPETSMARSSLFTGAVHEPQMYTELKKEIASADRIDMLVSFIKWSGLRLIMDELQEFTQNGGELRIITTSYMGATDVKAIEELRKLPGTPDQGQLQHQADPAPREGVCVLPQHRLHHRLCGLLQPLQRGADQRPRVEHQGHKAGSARDHRQDRRHLRVLLERPGI
jgi:hypothetical protein